MIWSIASLGGGYGSIAIKGDRIFVQGARDNQSTLYVLSRSNGQGLWSKAVGPAGTNDRGSGPRGTPTIDDDRVYVLTENGHLACLKVQDGTEVWRRDILRDFNGRQINWLISESPLVDGDRLIVMPGGRGAGMDRRSSAGGGARRTDDRCDVRRGAGPRPARLPVPVLMPMTPS